MWTWPFKTSPLGIGTIIAGVVVVSSSLAAAIVNDKIEICNAGWETKLKERELTLEELRSTMQAKIDDLTDKLRTAEEAANVKAVEDRVNLEKQRETDKLSDDCARCRVPNSWIWVLPKTGDQDKSRPAASSSRVPTSTGSTR